MKTTNRKRSNRRGVINTTDVVLVATILVLGSIVGLVLLRNQVVQEFVDVGDAIGALNQSYYYEGDHYSGTTLDLDGDGNPGSSVGDPPHWVVADDGISSTYVDLPNSIPADTPYTAITIDPITFTPNTVTTNNAGEQ